MQGSEAARHEAYIASIKEQFFLNSQLAHVKKAMIVVNSFFIKGEHDKGCWTGVDLQFNSGPDT